MFVLQLLTNKSKSDVIQKLQPAIQLDKTIGYYEVSYGLYGQAFGPFCEDKQYVKPFSVAISSQTHNGEGQKPLVQYFLKSETGVSFFDFDQQFSTRLGCNVGGFPAIRSSVPYELKVGDYFWLGAEEALLLEKFFSGEEQNWRILIGQDEYLLTAARVFGSDTDGIPIRKWNGKTFLVDQTDPHCKYVPLFCFDTDYAFHHIRMNANEWRSTSSSIWLFPTNTFNTPFTPLVKEGESLDFGFGGSVSLDKKPGMIDRLSLLQTHLDLGTFGLDADGFRIELGNKNGTQLLLSAITRQPDQTNSSKYISHTINFGSNLSEVYLINLKLDASTGRYNGTLVTKASGTSKYQFHNLNCFSLCFTRDGSYMTDLEVVRPGLADGVGGTGDYYFYFKERLKPTAAADPTAPNTAYPGEDIVHTYLGYKEKVGFSEITCVEGSIAFGAGKFKPRYSYHGTWVGMLDENNPSHGLYLDFLDSSKKSFVFNLKENLRSMPKPVPGEESAWFTLPYPNPVVSESFTLDLNVAFKPVNCSISVYDLLGRPVIDPISGYYEIGVHSFKIDIDSVPAGTYFIIGMFEGKQTKAIPIRVL